MANIEQALAWARRNGITVTKQPEPRRRTLVEGANVQAATPSIYQYGFLKEALQPQNWEALADRSHPLPENLSPKILLQAFQDLWFAQIADRNERMGI